MRGRLAGEREPERGDLAAHAELVEHGPGPLRRAAWGLLTGAALGALAALVTPRPAPPGSPGRR